MHTQAQTAVNEFSFCVKKPMRLHPKCFIKERNAGGPTAKKGFVLKNLLYLFRLLKSMLVEKYDIYDEESGQAIYITINILTCEMFQWWLMAATGSVATEHPHPMMASFTGGVWIP